MRLTIAALYRQGLTFEQIGVMLDRHPTRVLQIAHEIGLEIRHYRGGHYRDPDNGQYCHEDGSVPAC